MRVGYLVWPPAVIRDVKTGELTGIFPDMVKEIASALGVKVQWVETTLANFAAGLQSDQFDFSVGPTFVTIPRTLAVAFTAPVAYVGNSGVVKTGGSVAPKNVEDLGAPGLRIAVLQGQAIDEYVRTRLPGASLIVLSGGDLTAPLVAVSSGRADIGFMNSVTVAAYAAAHPEVKPVFTGADQIEVLPLAWATRRNAADLHTLLQSAITYLKATDKLAAIQRKYDIRLLYDTPQLHEAQ